MALSGRTFLRLRSPTASYVRAMSKGEPGSGSGEGGGTGGTIRDAGGSFGKREMAQEEQYFRRVQQEQLEKMRSGLKHEVKFHKQQIEAHEKALKRHQERLDDMEKLEH